MMHPGIYRLTIPKVDEGQASFLINNQVVRFDIAMSYLIIGVEIK
jgi:hypothetical protein